MCSKPPKKSNTSLFPFLLSLLVLSSCSLNPKTWQVPQKPEFKGPLELNSLLQQSQFIDLKGWYGAEDIIMDSDSNIYCGVHRGIEDFSDGKILKITPKGEVQVFYDAESWVAGLHFDANENLIALSHKEGLIQISPKGEVKILAQEDEFSRPFLIPNGLDIGSDGTIYFSNTSYDQPYSIKYGRKLILELRKNGGLYSFHPGTGEVKTLIDGTYFGNGVVLSKNEDFILMTETTKYRVLKYWLKGSKKGEVEVLMDNLPGFPNGISIRENGSFWLGFTTIRNDALDKIHSQKNMKKLMYSLPNFLQPQQEAFGMILNIDEHGEILQALFDPSGTVIPEAGAVKEYHGKLYLGGDIVSRISCFQL